MATVREDVNTDIVIKLKVVTSDVAMGNVDLSNYYTKKEIDNKGYITELDLTDYALKSEIPDVSNFATKDELPAGYDDTELTNRVSALEISLGNIDTILDTLNGEVV